jgi:hypothetical protein
VVPSDWITQSTDQVSTDLGGFSDREGFGYLWWVNNSFNGTKVFYTSGSGGHRIAVFPEFDMVIVHRSNTYEGRGVSDNEVDQLFKNILEAKKGAGINNPKTKKLIHNKTKPQTNSSYTVNEDFLGKYKHPFLGYFKVRRANKKFELHTNIGVFDLLALDKNHFIPEDLETTMEFLPAPDKESRFTIKPVFRADRSLEKGILYY